ncbi:hypothetical protein [Candidatus Methylobacter oryzae]|uniref:Uncharacterized protein n=1 Tax=Candidatus Methylobacter oryzae TaxID=2497749 RepID=A0ABY3C5Z0_9GAMM|nr:hypothetical protein [Candidatus Methylobacter oryzae]TRW89720.1 hypothetical protein EKO24_021985 [Candidatus Methylobacter oryzae]
MTTFKSWLLALSLVTFSLMTNVATAAAIKVSVSFPKGSAGEKIAKTLPTSTKISPCNDITKTDAVTFTAVYDATNPASTTAAPLSPLDLHLFFYNPDAVNGANKFYSISKGLIGATTTGVSVTAYADAAAIQAAMTGGTLIPYLAGANNFNTASFTEVVFGSSIRLDVAGGGVGTGLNTGTWQLIGILADSATVDFTDPATWTAWDVVTVMFGMPWKGTAATTLETCQ